MRRLRRLPGGDFRRGDPPRRRRLWTDFLPESCRVFLRTEHLHGNRPEIRVAEVRCAVGEGPLLRFDDPVDCPVGERAVGGEIETLEDIEYLDEGCPAGARRRRRDDPSAAVRSLHRPTFDRPVSPKILPGHEPAAPQHLLLDQPRRLAVVEPRRAPVGDPAKHGCEIGIPEDRSLVQQTAVRPEKESEAGKPVDIRIEPSERGGEMPAHPETLFREQDGRGEKLTPGQRPRALVREGKPGDGPRHASRAVPEAARRVDRLSVETEVHVSRRPEGRRLPEIEEGGLSPGPAEHHEAATADVPCGRPGDRERESHGDGRIDGVSPVREDLRPDRRRDRTGGHDHPAGGAGPLRRDAPPRQQRDRHDRGRVSPRLPLHSRRAFLSRGRIP